MQIWVLGQAATNAISPPGHANFPPHAERAALTNLYPLYRIQGGESSNKCHIFAPDLASDIPGDMSEVDRHVADIPVKGSISAYTPEGAGPFPVLNPLHPRPKVEQDPV